MNTMLFSSLMPPGMLVFGPVADIVKIEWLLLATGAIMLIHGFSMPLHRRLMEADVSVAKSNTAGSESPGSVITEQQ